MNKISHLAPAILLVMAGAILSACNPKNGDDSVEIVDATGKALDWPHWRGPNRNSIVSDSDWDPALLNRKDAVKWQANVGSGFSSVSLKGGLLYTAGYRDNANTIYCSGYGRHDPTRLSHRGKVNEIGTVFVLRRDFIGGFDCKAGFAEAAGSGKGQETESTLLQ